MAKHTGWGEVSEWYDKVVQDDDSYQAQVILPNLLRMMEIKPGEYVFDLACGQGFFAKAFKEKGALVAGADISVALIDIATRQGPDMRFFVAPSDKVVQIKNATQDKVAIVLALQNIEKLAETVGEISRMLKPAGSAFIVLNHPVLRTPGISSWGFDEEAKVQYRRLDGYMSETSKEIVMNPGSEGEKKVTHSFHRPLQVYFKALRKHGLAVTRLEEWISHKESEKGPRQTAENRSRKEFPMFLSLECRKI